MTGHAFQVFLTRDDRSAAVLKTIAAHLAPNGRFVFDTRNPASPRVGGMDSRPRRARRFIDAEYGEVSVWNDVVCDPATGIVTYQTHYDVAGTGKRYSARCPHRLPGAGRGGGRWLKPLISASESMLRRLGRLAPARECQGDRHCRWAGLRFSDCRCAGR
jgi:hypothetical protein